MAEAEWDGWGGGETERKWGQKGDRKITPGFAGHGEDCGLLL